MFPTDLTVAFVIAFVVAVLIAGVVHFINVCKSADRFDKD